ILLLRTEELPLRPEPVPPILLLQLVIPSHHAVFDILETELLVENREIFRVLVGVRSGESADGENRVMAFLELKILRSDVVTGDSGGNPTIEVRECRRLEVRNEQHLVNHSGPHSFRFAFKR